MQTKESIRMKMKEKESITTIAFDRVIGDEDGSEKQREKKTELGFRHCWRKKKMGLKW